jgi:hypothetical protein
MFTRYLTIILLLVLLVSCGSRSPELQSQGPEQLQQSAMDKPLARFAQELTTTQKKLALKSGQTTQVSITIRNTTDTVLASNGRYPITLSYKWFDDGTMLPIEGDRTVLPRPLPPDAQEAVLAKVTAPQSGSNLILRFSLVQEGVAWFFSKNATTLDIPVTLQP